MTRDRLPPRRESLRGEDGSPTRAAAAAAGRSGAPVRRRPKTYARKRARAEAARRAAKRSAEHSLDTRNCGEGRLSLPPLPAAAEGAQVAAAAAAAAAAAESESESDSTGDGVDARRRVGAKKRAAKPVTRKGAKRPPLADRDANEERALQEFMRQQRAFWKEVDDIELLEEDVG